MGDEVFAPEAIHALLPSIGGRISVALDEIIRIQKTFLPALIARENTALSKKIPVPSSKGYRLAPQTIDDNALNQILIAFASVTEPNGVRYFKDTWDVSLYSVDERLETPGQVGASTDRAKLIVGLMAPTFAGHQDSAGRKVWTTLVPTGLDSSLPPQYAGFAGTAVHFRLVQPPGANLWV